MNCPSSAVCWGPYKNCPKLDRGWRARKTPSFLQALINFKSFVAPFEKSVETRLYMNKMQRLAIRKSVTKHSDAFEPKLNLHWIGWLSSFRQTTTSFGNHRKN